MNCIDPLRSPVQNTVVRPITGADRHHQYGEVPNVSEGAPQGTIVTPKPGDWVWALLSVALLFAMCTFNFWYPMLSKLIGA